MSLEKVKALLGLCQRAGKLTSGSSLIMQKLAKLRPGTGLVLVAADALTPTGDALIRKCQYARIPAARIPLDMVELGLIIGKNQRGYVLVQDQGFADRILELLKDLEVSLFE